MNESKQHTKENAWLRPSEKKREVATASWVACICETVDLQTKNHQHACGSFLLCMYFALTIAMYVVSPSDLCESCQAPRREPAFEPCGTG